MSTAKQEVRELLDNLPDDSTIEDIQYHLYVLEKVRRGRDDIRVEMLGNGMRITVTYTVVIELPGYQLELNFKPTADNMSI